jgi:rRNA maturation RNase YbeY
MIEFSMIDVEVPGLYPELFVLWLSDVVGNEGKLAGDINIVFCSDEHLWDMNRQYLDHDYYTDIITFDYCEEDVVSGDLFISIDRVKENAVLLKEEYTRELKRVCVHGVLHLCGYFDKTDHEKTSMRELENFYLDRYVSRGT